MKRLRVLVCGTNYGQTYIQAIQQAPKSFQLAGILARGSTRSIETARKWNVPFHRDVENLDANIDIACAAMGSSATQVVLQLLERGIHVLCEHPVKPDFVEAAIRAANTRGTCFHVNGHFANLKAAAAFIKYSNLMSPSACPAFFDGMVTERSLYGALDILRRVTKTFEPLDLSARERFLPFTVVQGTLGGVPATFQVQRSASEGRIDLQDGDRRYYVDYRLAVGFPEGILSLLSVAGPVIWNSNFSPSADTDHPRWTSVYNKPATSYDLYRERVRANLDALRSLVKSVREDVVPAEQTSNYLSEVSLAWEKIGGLICRQP